MPRHASSQIQINMSPARFLRQASFEGVQLSGDPHQRLRYGVMKLSGHPHPFLQHKGDAITVPTQAHLIGSNHSYAQQPYREETKPEGFIKLRLYFEIEELFAD